MATSNGTNQSDGGSGASTPSLEDAQLLYIDGQHVPSCTNATFPITNPMTGDKIYDAAAASGVVARVELDDHGCAG